MEVDDYDREVDGTLIPEGSLEIFHHFESPPNESVVVKEGVYLHRLMNALEEKNLQHYAKSIAAAWEKVIQGEPFEYEEDKRNQERFKGLVKYLEKEGWELREASKLMKEYIESPNSFFKFTLNFFEQPLNELYEDQKKFLESARLKESIMQSKRVNKDDGQYFLRYTKDRKSLVRALETFFSHENTK